MTAIERAEMRRKWEGYRDRLNQGDGDGSIIGASFIIAKTAPGDIFALLDDIDRILTKEDT